MRWDAEQNTTNTSITYDECMDKMMTLKTFLKLNLPSRNRFVDFAP